MSEDSENENEFIAIYENTTQEHVHQLLELLPADTSTEKQMAFANECFFAIEVAYRVKEAPKLGLKRKALKNIAEKTSRLRNSINDSLALPNLKSSMREQGHDHLAGCMAVLKNIEEAAIRESEFLAKYSRKKPPDSRQILVDGLFSAWGRVFGSDPDISHGWKREDVSAPPFLEIVSWCIQHGENRHPTVEVCRHLARDIIKLRRG